MQQGLTVAALALTVLAGCTAALLPGVRGGMTEATLEVRPDFRTARSVQSVVTPYSSADVNHLLVKVFTVSGSTETQATGSQGAVQGDIAGGDLAKPLVFAGLQHGTTYRVRGYAYKMAGAQDADLISDSGSSYVDVTVAGNNRPDIATLSVQLVDRPFSGAGTGSIEIKTGTLEGPGGDEAIQVGSPS